VHFLLADDQEEIRELTTHCLERGGHTVVSSADGVAALQAFHRDKFDVVLLDEEMPAMNGVQVLRTIRAQEQATTDRTFIIALTGNNTPEDCRRLLAAGFDAVLGKPFRIESLNALINAAPEHLSRPEKSVLPPPASVVQKTPLERVGGDQVLLRRLIRLFLRDNPKRMATLSRALSAKDSATVLSCAHSLKGSLSIFATEQALEILKRFQLAVRDKDFLAAARHHSAFKEDIANLEVNLRRYAKQPKVKPRPKRR
jgi:two-component system sensor histidine kinase/response regulator